MGNDRVAELVNDCLEVHTIDCLVNAFTLPSGPGYLRRDYRLFFSGDYGAIEVSKVMLLDLEDLAKALCVCKLMPELGVCHPGAKTS